MEIKGFKLVNDEKVDRANNGTIGAKGQLAGGVGSESPEAILAEYDRLGGLVLKDGERVATGSFYDFSAKAPRKEPKISYVAEIDGDLVEVSEVEAKAIKTAKKKKDEVKAKIKKLKKD